VVYNYIAVGLFRRSILDEPSLAEFAMFKSEEECVLKKLDALFEKNLRMLLGHDKGKTLTFSVLNRIYEA